MKTVTISTQKKKQILDITHTIENEIENQENGICILFVKHTTAALTTADLDPGTDLDMLDAFEAMMPKLHYRHPHNPSHVTYHILSSLIGASLTIPVQDGKLVLGTWQRIVLVELDGPRRREISYTFIFEE